MNREDLAEKVYLEEPHTPEVSFGYCRLCGDEILEDDYYYEYGEKWHPTCYYIMKKGEEEREQNMKYKVGDKVKIREDLIVDVRYDGERGYKDTFVDEMVPYLGKIATITMVRDRVGKYKLDIDGGDWAWTLDMLEDVEEKKFDYSVGETVSFTHGTETIKGTIEKIEDWHPFAPDYYINGKWYDQYAMRGIEVIKEDEFEEAMSLREEVDHDQVIKDFLYEIVDKIFELWKED